MKLPNLSRLSDTRTGSNPPSGSHLKALKLDPQKPVERQLKWLLSALTRWMVPPEAPIDAGTRSNIDGGS